MIKNVIIYIHGISPRENLATIASAESSNDLQHLREEKRIAKISHSGDYKRLKNGIEAHLLSAKKKVWKEGLHCFTEWGWEYKESDAKNLGKSHRLKDAQHYIAQRQFQFIKNRIGFSFFPQKRLRTIALYGLSDAFYYLSTDGQKSVRARIYNQLYNQIEPIIVDLKNQIALTIIGHSAGSIVAFDIMNFLGSDISVDELESQQKELEKKQERLRRRQLQQSSPYTKGQAVIRDTLDVVKSQLKLASLSRSARILPRFLITMGSPLSMIYLRSDENVDALAYGMKVNYNTLGPFNMDSGAEFKWINFWDKNDFISYPVSPLFTDSPQIIDVHVRSAWNPLKSHTNYWKSQNVHKNIAIHWQDIR